MSSISLSSHLVTCVHLIDSDWNILQFGNFTLSLPKYDVFLSETVCNSARTFTFIDKLSCLGIINLSLEFQLKSILG